MIDFSKKSFPNLWEVWETYVIPNAEIKSRHMDIYLQLSNLYASNGSGYKLYPELSQENRDYHNHKHIVDMANIIHHLDIDKGYITTMMLACIWHDAVYDTQRNDNEIRSGYLAASQLLQLGFSLNIASVVGDIIRETKDHKGSNVISSYLQDVDMAILAHPDPLIYDAYADGVMNEYLSHGQIPLSAYLQGRIKFIDNILNEDQIFSMDLFMDHEDDARDNLKREKLKLSSFEELSVH